MLSTSPSSFLEHYNALVASGAIPAKNIKFIAAIPGGGSLVQAVKSGSLQGFEFATPLDDVSQLFDLNADGILDQDNPGTVGVRYVHLPGPAGPGGVTPHSAPARPSW